MATTVVLNVPGISCNHCKMAIEGAVRPLAGVDDAVVDVAAKSVTVRFDEAVVSLAAIEAAIGDQGYEVAGRHVFGT